jgi:hypothetical protein
LGPATGTGAVSQQLNTPMIQDTLALPDWKKRLDLTGLPIA